MTVKKNSLSSLKTNLIHRISTMSSTSRRRIPKEKTSTSRKTTIDNNIKKSKITTKTPIGSPFKT
jgi:hypothetical protein